MFSISNNGIIRLNRGDTFSLSVTINIGTELDPVIYPLAEGDKVYFALMEPKQPFECALIRKVFTAEDQDEFGNITMDFSSDQTSNLVPGNYYYMVKLVRDMSEESGDEKMLVDTIINKTKFILLD